MVSKALGWDSFGSMWGHLECLKVTWELLWESLRVAWGSLGAQPWATWGSVEARLGPVGGPKAPRASPLAFGGDSTPGGWGAERARWRQGRLSEASVRPQGGKGARAGPAYEVLRTTKRSSEDLTRRWARGPANFSYTNKHKNHRRIARSNLN